MSASPEWLRLIWEIMLTVISGGAAIYVFLQTRHAAQQSETNLLSKELVELQHNAVTREDTDKLWEYVHEIDKRRSTAVGELKDRIKDLESAQKHMPNATEVARLIAGVEFMKESMTSLHKQVQTMDDYLRKTDR